MENLSIGDIFVIAISIASLFGVINDIARNRRISIKGMTILLIALLINSVNQLMISGFSISSISMALAVLAMSISILHELRSKK